MPDIVSPLIMVVLLNKIRLQRLPIQVNICFTVDETAVVLEAARPKTTQLTCMFIFFHLTHDLVI